MSRHKYPHTPHLPFSRSRTGDDKVLTSVAHFLGKRIVVTKKMDGENTTLHPDGFHARSLDSRHHSSRDWVAAFRAQIAHGIPAGWRVCGENLFARHSIAYSDLPSYFMGFSVWNEANVSLGWNDSLAFFARLGIEPVPELHRGVFSEKLLRKLAQEWDTEKDEGFVVRLEGAIRFEDFGHSMAKWVRPKHVQTDEHWMHRAIVPNGLR